MSVTVRFESTFAYRLAPSPKLMMQGSTPAGGDCTTKLIWYNPTKFGVGPTKIGPGGATNHLLMSITPGVGGTLGWKSKLSMKLTVAAAAGIGLGTPVATAGFVAPTPTAYMTSCSPTFAGCSASTGDPSAWVTTAALEPAFCAMSWTTTVSREWSTWMASSSGSKEMAAEWPAS